MRDLLKLEQLLVHHGLSPSTRKNYLGIARRIEGDPVVWFHAEVVKNQPTNTLLPLRATAKYLLMAERGLTKSQATALLPAAKGTEGLRVEGLTESELPVYIDAVDKLSEPVRTLLLLLPWSGLRIQEATKLRWVDVVPRSDSGKVTLAVQQGKGRKARMVPLGATGTKLILALRSRVRGTPWETSWVFSGSRRTPVSAPTVGRHLRDALAANPALVGVTPHRLRHTYATRLIERGATLKDVQALLGHKSITSTERYLHPSTAHLGGVVDKLEP
jgi:site-specific recombinase XerD